MNLLEQTHINVSTRGRGTFEITQEISNIVRSFNVEIGTVHVFLQHTSASLVITENADPDVRRDLDTFMLDLVPDGDSRYLHQDEGPDDMPAHVRTALTQTEFTLPISNGRLGLGTWQGLFIWEHRTVPHNRRLVITMMGKTRG